MNTDDEIKRLRSVVEAWLNYSQRAERDIETLRAERDKAIAEIKRLRQENATLTAERDALWRLTDRLTAEHDALRAERDAARREVCEARAACIQGKTATEIAEALGWSCFQRKAQP